MQPISADQIPEFLAAVHQAFHGQVRPVDVEVVGAVLEPERTLVVRDAGRIVATTGIYSRRMTVPGGELPVAGVTQTGVLPTHRRRGLLTGLMRRQLDDVRAAGEAVAALWASETAIYGRFGYGMATIAAHLEVNTREARLRRPPELRAELLEPAEAKPAMAAIHDAVRRSRPGMLDRPGAWWDFRTADPEYRREGMSPLKAAVVEGHAYALYAAKTGWHHGAPAGEVGVREVVAATPEGAAAIWDYLLSLDLVRRVSHELAASDDPLPHLLTEAQAVQARVGEGLWVRVVDVARALTARTYTAPFEAVLELADEFCPWNAGAWALAWNGRTATCEPTTAAPDLALSAADLGAAYLGGTTLEQLARAGRVRELRPGGLAPASLAFRGDRAPWCPDIF